MLNNYTASINDIVNKGYAKVAEILPDKDTTWYIPHYDVYNPQKPEGLELYSTAL